MADSIVVPVDLSEPSLTALKFAALLAKSSRRGIEAVFAVSATRVRPSGQKPATAAGLVGELTAEAKKGLLEALAALDKSVEVQGVVREGPAAEVIEAYAKERGASLLVMGTHGRTGVGRWVLGSVAERVIRTVDTPTLVVPAQYEEVPGGPIVVAYDFSENSRRALEEAKKLANAMGSELHVLHVYADPWADRRAYHEAKGHRIKSEDIRERALEVGMQKVLEDELAGAATAVTRKGVADDVVVSYANEVGAAVVALGSTGKDGVERALLGSTAQRLFRTVQRPLLVVH